LRKVENSTLKKCGKEKAKRMFHPKCRNKRRKVNSLHYLHFLSVLLLEKKDVIIFFFHFLLFLFKMKKIMT
jgi:hypothetical protein